MRRTTRHTPAFTMLAAATALAATGLAAVPTAATAASDSSRQALHPAAAQPAAAHPVPADLGHRMTHGQLPSPLSTSQCQATFQASCYGPTQLEAAYNEAPLFAKGINGRGRTIVIVDSFGSPTIQHDLDVYSAQYGIPSTQVQVVRWGDVPPFNPNDPDQTGWAEETTIDVDMAHAMAPGAHIVLVETGVSETEGVTGFPEMMAAEDSLVKHGVGDVISQSFGATENTFPGFDQGDFSSLLNLRFAYKDAAARGVTVLAASGDNGATDAELDGSTLYPYRVTSWPPSDPLVTAVGGTTVNLDDQGNRLSPDQVWDDQANGGGASGGGLSAIFSRPFYQDGVQSVVGTHRGVPDIAMEGDPYTGVWTYNSFGPNDDGWELWGGTSVATPIFSGVVALAAQEAGHRLGNINPALYLLGELSTHKVPKTGLVDIVGGTNSYAGVTGFPVTPGYDLATGWGTVDAAQFVPALAALSRLGG